MSSLMVVFGGFMAAFEGGVGIRRSRTIFDVFPSLLDEMAQIEARRRYVASVAFYSEALYGVLCRLPFFFGWEERASLSASMAGEALWQNGGFCS